MIVQLLRPPVSCDIFAVTEDWMDYDYVKTLQFSHFKKSSPLLSSLPPSAALPAAVQGTCWRCFRAVWLGRVQLQYSPCRHLVLCTNNSPTITPALSYSHWPPFLAEFIFEEQNSRTRAGGRAEIFGSYFKVITPIFHLSSNSSFEVCLEHPDPWLLIIIKAALFT